MLKSVCEAKTKYNSELLWRAFPGGPVVRVQCFHCSMTLIPSQGTKTLHATQHGEKKECYCGKCFESGSISCSVISDSATPWTVAHQDPPSMEFSRQEYRSSLPLSTLGIFLTQGSNLHFLHPLHWQVVSSPLCHLGSPHPKLDLSQKAKKQNFDLAVKPEPCDCILLTSLEVTKEDTVKWEEVSSSPNKVGVESVRNPICL